jgi:wyosine [tRNA(Phe)-imidazoG37] synthetase (radical SAM superfamily)
MQYIFGPIPSRRLGQSLGIDPIPFKTCNWNCVYCQLGRTRPLVNERKDYAPPEAILAEVRQALAAHAPGALDWVTFVGSGEPTLHAGLGRMIRAVKQLTDVPVAVITNGALLYLPEVREELAAADAVLPTLNAGTAALYRRITRPHPDLTFTRLVDGLIAFRDVYHGKLWIEVMLIRDLNDTEEPLQALTATLRRIRPDAVHITLSIRPPAEPWVQPADEAGVTRAVTILGANAQVVHPSGESFGASGGATITDAIVAILTRHPMREEEVEYTLARWAPDAVRQALAALAADGQVQIVERYGTRFWCAGPAYYQDAPQGA